MAMLSLKHAARGRAISLTKTKTEPLFSHIFCILDVSTSSSLLFFSSSAASNISSRNGVGMLFSPWRTTRTPMLGLSGDDKSMKDVASSVKEWFRSSNHILFNQIFRILQGVQDEVEAAHRCSSSVDLSLSQLGLRLSESLVLDVLRYGQSKDALSCLRFFDWAGRQPGFYHTRATFNAIFKILSRAKLMPLTLEVFDNYIQHWSIHKVRFYDTLVMGYAIVGKPNFALQLFGKMRFQGLDLDSFAYHILLNALVEENCFDAFQVIANQISLRGFENSITHYIMIKSFCKQKQMNEAESFLYGLVNDGHSLKGRVLSVLVDALCKSGQFERAGKMIEEFRDLGRVQVEHSYGVWIRALAQAGRLDGALQFMKSKQSFEGYVPEVFRYNVLICGLLKENRLQEVYDLLMEMKEGQITPDEVTMNATLCFFCKAGMVEVACDLYNLRSELKLSPNNMAYNYLINTLCGDGSTDEAYFVLKNSMDQGYLPGKITLSILTDALCREGKFDKMKELVLVALERNFIPSNTTFDRFISTLCKAGKVEDGYLIHGELNKINKVATKNTYCSIIYGFTRTDRGDIAARLLIEMQDKGHKPTCRLFRAVIRCLCEMENTENHIFKLLEFQLSREKPNCQTYNFFIDGAGHARKCDLARQVYEMMRRIGLEPSLSSNILMLKAYLYDKRISNALSFLSDVRQRRKVSRKLCNTMVVGLCKANKEDIALDFMNEMSDNGVKPSIECCEVLVQSLCTNEKYDLAVCLINDLEKVGRHITSFIGNILLLHSLKTHKLYEAWVQLREVHHESSRSSMLGLLIGTFSGHIRMTQHIDIFEEVVKKCFPVDIYTYNMLLRRLSISDMDHALELADRMFQKGYEPNRWTYDILVHGLFKHGRKSEAKRWLEEMIRKGFHPTGRTKALI